MAKKVRMGQVALDRDLKITTKVGEVKDFDTNKSYATISRTKTVNGEEVEKSAMEILEEIFSKDTPPTVTQPSLSTSLQKSNQVVEPGTQVTVKATPSFDAGRYSFGPSTGVTHSNVVVQLKRGTTVLESLTGGKVTDITSAFAAVAMGEEDDVLKVEASCDHSQGAVPLSQLENQVPASRIVSGSKNAASQTAATSMRAIFFGCLTTTTVTASAIRGLEKKLNKSLSFFQYTATASTRAMVLAIPAGRNKSIQQAIMTSALNAPVTSLFEKSTVQIEGANGFTAVNYDVWVYAPSAGFAGGETVEITIM